MLVVIIVVLVVIIVVLVVIIAMLVVIIAMLVVIIAMIVVVVAMLVVIIAMIVMIVMTGPFDGNKASQCRIGRIVDHVRFEAELEHILTCLGSFWQDNFPFAVPMESGGATQNYGISHFIQGHAVKTECHSRIESGDDQGHFDSGLERIYAFVGLIELDQAETGIAAGPQDKSTDNGALIDFEHLAKVVIHDQRTTVRTTGADHQIDVRIIGDRVRAATCGAEKNQRQHPSPQKHSRPTPTAAARPGTEAPFTTLMHTFADHFPHSLADPGPKSGKLV